MILIKVQRKSKYTKKYEKNFCGNQKKIVLKITVNLMQLYWRSDVEAPKKIMKTIKMFYSAFTLYLLDTAKLRRLESAALCYIGGPILDSYSCRYTPLSGGWVISPVVIASSR